MSHCCLSVVLWYLYNEQKRLIYFYCGTLNQAVILPSHHKYVYITSHTPPIPDVVVPQNNMPVTMATGY